MSRNFELLRQANKEQQVFTDNDFVSKVSKITQLRQSEENQELFKPSGPLPAPYAVGSSLDSLPSSGQHIVPANSTGSLKSEFAFLFRGLAQLPSQTKKLLLRPARGRRTPQHAKKNQTTGRKILAQAALIREEESKLVQRVFLLQTKDAPRAVIFTGVEHGDGCSWVCARAAETLAAQVEGTVCVVDANLQSPSLHQYFGVQNGHGLTEAVLHPGPLENYLQQLPLGNLWVLTSGATPADPHALFTSDALRSRMKELIAVFNYVLIDSPPVNLFVDATLLGHLADGVVLVVGANSTRRETARKAKETLEASNLRLLAAVLNKRTYPIPESIYKKL